MQYNDLAMAPLYRNHFPEEIDFTKKSVCCDKHYSFQSAFVLSFVMTSFPCRHFTVIFPLRRIRPVSASSPVKCQRVHADMFPFFAYVGNHICGQASGKQPPTGSFGGHARGLHPWPGERGGLRAGSGEGKGGGTAERNGCVKP